MPTDFNDTLDSNKKIYSAEEFGSQGTLLFLDQLLVALGSWIYWLAIVSKVNSSEVGQVTSIYSLVALISTFLQLGLEYPLLKRSFTEQRHILVTVLAIELVITLAAVPIVPYIITNVFQKSSQGLFKFSWIGVGILISSSVGYVSRFALLGIFDVKSVLIIDIIGSGLKFVVAYYLVFIGFGALGLLLPFLLQNLVIAGATLVVAKRREFGFRLGNLRYTKEIIREGLINMPSKLSRMLIISLSVVLLASFGVKSSEIGIFYVALMVSIVALGGLALNIAYMVLPASAVSRADLSSTGTRISVTLIAPIVAALITSPRFILSMIGTQYTSAETILMILSIAILPASITMNAISKFNNLNKPKKLMLVGFTEILTFLIAFFFLVPYYGILGAAFSTLIAFVSSSILSLIWSERTPLRYIVAAGVSIFAGSVSAYIFGSNFGIHPLETMMISIVVTAAGVIALKNTSPKEIRQLVRGKQQHMSP
jgi:O-antigen/teichoic acid export membrane protein